jgi:hypothetical protein
VRHVRMLGLCLVAAFAVAALGASSAMAGPQWVKCEYVGSGGNYNESSPGSGTSNCTKAEKAKPKGSGEYELYKAPEIAAKRGEAELHIPFSGASVGGGGVLSAGVRACYGEGEHIHTTRQKCAEEGYTEESLETELPAIECETETNTGEAEGKNRIANVHVTFTGCLYFGSAPCNSAGAEEGEINTSTLKGKLGYINKSKQEVGVVLEPAQKHAAFAEFQCAGILEFWVGVGNKKEGSAYVQGPLYPEGCLDECPGATPEEEKHGGYDQVISPITPVNAMTSEFTQVYTNSREEAPYGNIPHKLEGKHISALESYFNTIEGPVQWANAGEEITNVNTPEEPGEIKA